MASDSPEHQGKAIDGTPPSKRKRCNTLPGLIAEAAASVQVRKKLLHASGSNNTGSYHHGPPPGSNSALEFIDIDASILVGDVPPPANLWEAIEGQIKRVVTHQLHTDNERAFWFTLMPTKGRVALALSHSKEEDFVVRERAILRENVVQAFEKENEAMKKLDALLAEERKAEKERREELMSEEDHAEVRARVESVM